MLGYPAKRLVPQQRYVSDQDKRAQTRGEYEILPELLPISELLGQRALNF